MPELGCAASELAAELDLPVAESIAAALSLSPGLLLVMTVDGVELREADKPRRTALKVDCSNIDIRVGSGGLSRKQPLIKAFGQRVRTIIDATAGLGHDAFLLACCGFEVTAFERHSVVFALLRDGLRRANLDPRLSAALNGRLRVGHADALAILGDLQRQSDAGSHEGTLTPTLPLGEKERWDAIFIDPMFPPKRKKSALAKKSIRLVRQLVGDDADATELLDLAMLSVRDRVVVKRADDAPPLRDKPSLSFGGKLARYDVYLIGR